MAITTAIQKGSSVYVYDGNRQLFVKLGTLHGYTATTVSVKNTNGKVLYTYKVPIKFINAEQAVGFY